MTERMKKYLGAAVIALLMCALILTARWSGTFVPAHDGVPSVLITDRHGVPLRERLSVDQGRNRWIELDEISPHMIAATVIAEDKRFYRHIGVDPIAVARALVSNIRAGRILSGGSTITQQLARMLKPARRTLGTKVREALHALWLEITLSKDEILAQYLNRAPYGNQLFGVEAAARMYFDKPARDLSIAESAFLAILPRAPSAYNPYHRRALIEREHRELIERMYRADAITSTERDGALAEKLIIEPKRFAFTAPHFVDMLPDLHGGDMVRTSLDSGIQRRVEDIIGMQLMLLERYDVHNAAVVVVDNATGEIRALAGSANFADDDIEGQVNGATAKRQPGSTLKPFLYTLAMERGYTAASVLPDVPLSFPTKEGDYEPRNYDLRYRGPVRLRAALANSLNVPAVHMTSRVGTSNLLRMLVDAGFTSLDREPEYYGLGLTLGNGEVTLLELAGGYAALARGGMYFPLTPFPREGVPKGKRIVSPSTAYMISDILSDDETRRMSFGEDSPLDLPFRVAAKTGTSKNYRDNWTVGFTPEYTVAVWAGNFDGEPMKGASGITGAAPIFREVMLALAEDRPPSWFEKPSDISTARICPLSGMPPSEHCTTTIEERFVGNSAPRETCSFHVEHAVDTRNGLLASDSCDKAVTRVRSFLNLPGRYHEWARAYDIPLAPRTYSPYCAPARNTALAEDVPAAPSIVHPRDGSTYAVDPHIPRRLQVLTFQARADNPLTWTVNGSKIAQTVGEHQTSWRIAEGRHTIAIVEQDGTVADSVQINVTSF